MKTITKREECRALTEWHPIGAIHEHFVLFLAMPTLADEVTPDRLINANNEPHNRLMNHRTYDAQRYSPLDKINKSNVKSLKPAYAVALGDASANEKCCLCLRYVDVRSIVVASTPAGSREPACFGIRTG